MSPKNNPDVSGFPDSNIDATGQLNGVTAGTTAGGSENFAYGYEDGDSNLASITASGLGQNITTSYIYQPNTDWLQSITVQDGNTTLYSITYTRDAPGRIDNSTVTGTDANGRATVAQATYTYDPTTGQLSTDWQDQNSVLLANNTYSFDEVGNLPTTFGSPNDVNEYANDFSYNARGDLTNDNTFAYSYDALDRLISAVPDSPTVGGLDAATYDYDDLGRRVSKTTYAWNGQEWVRNQELKFSYSGSNLIAEFTVGTNPTTGQEQDTLLQSYASGKARVSKQCPWMVR